MFTLYSCCFTNYALNFIDSNKQKPFFLFYSIPLCHKPFTPTPDDPEYATWDYEKSSERFFPSMVKYMDKQLMLLNDKIYSLSLQNNTVFIYVGDNGSPKGITSQFNGNLVPGEKGQTTTYGTHVPLIVSWPGHIRTRLTPPGVSSDQLIDLTDFLPTLANIASMPVPQSLGTLDGKSFYSVLTGSVSSSRDYVFDYFQPNISSTTNSRTVRYVQNRTYKLYGSGRFYNIVLDVEENSPIANDQLTPDELQTKGYFKQLLDQIQ